MSLLAQYSRPRRVQSSQQSNQSGPTSSHNPSHSQQLSLKSQTTQEGRTHGRGKRALVGPQLVLVTPFSTIYSEALVLDLDALVMEASRTNIIAFIKDKTDAEDLGNLNMIEPRFWDEELRAVIEQQLAWGEKEKGEIEILASLNGCQETKVTKIEVFNFLGAMLLGTMPPQMHIGLTELIPLMRG